MLRALAGAAIVLVLYFVLPLDSVRERSTWLALMVVVASIVALMVWQVRAIIDAADPRIRAVEALALSVALLLVGFAAVHCVIARSDPAAYSEELSRMDALYFSTTTLSTVGFGDITPVSQAARIAVTVQMITNLAMLGIGVRVIVGAVHVGRERGEENLADRL